MNFLFSFLGSITSIFAFSFVIIGAVLFPELIPALMYGCFFGLLATIIYLADKNAEQQLPEALNAGKLLRQEAMNSKWALQRAENDRILKTMFKEADAKEKEFNDAYDLAEYKYNIQQENEQAIAQALNLGDTDMNTKTFKASTSMWEPRGITQNWGISTNQNYKPRCRYCNHALTDSDSVSHGAGKACRQKHENDAFLNELEAVETQSLEYLETPGLFAAQRFETHLKLVKESFMKYNQWGRETYLRFCAASINRMMADKEVAEFIEQDPSGSKGKFWIQAKTIQEKDETALRHYFN